MKPVTGNTDIDRKIAMYRALRTIQDKINKGQLVILNKAGAIDLKEQLFVITRTANALAIADQDDDLFDVKYGYDQQMPKGAR